MQKGVSLYLAILVLVVLLGITLGLSTLLFTQIRIIRGMEDSVTAFQAADTGIEAVLYLGSEATTSGNYSGSLNNSASWTAKVINPEGSEGGVECPADTSNFCIHSRGTYKETQRAIQVTR